MKGTTLRRGLTRSCGCLHDAVSARNLYAARAAKIKTEMNLYNVERSLA